MREEKIVFDSRDGISKIHAMKWIPDAEQPIAILQITHGMAEYIGRYREFAQYLADRGILVVGDDHLGHGETAADGGIKGYFCKHDPATVVVRDEHRLKKTIQQDYPGVPFFLLGHSMGSFIARNYLCRYGSGIDGAIIMGTGMQPKALLVVSKILAGLTGLFCGDKHPAKMINQIAFGAYNKRIENATTNSWLSRRAENVTAYDADPDCGFVFTVNGFKTLFELIWRLHDQEALAKMPKDLPVLFVAGEEDPVGEYGKAVKAVYSDFVARGMEAELKLYPEDRHEILNEVDREMVYEDLYQWLMRRLEV